jgi:formylglycine-generating enzyme
MHAALAALVLTMVPYGSPAASPSQDDFVVIPVGHFTMGSTAADTKRDKVTDEFAVLEYPAHEVTVPAFLLGRYDVTVGDFAKFVDDTGYDTSGGCNVWDGFKWTKTPGAGWRKPGFEQTDRHPVVCVSIADVNAYAAWYSKKMGRAYRLPSEAEWEHAARAGTTTSRYWGDDPSVQCTYANGSSLTYAAAFPQEPDVERGCADGYVYTSPAGTFKPNPWGLYDMLGDVWQWTSDCANKGYNGAPSDGSAWMTGHCGTHFYRGGSWYDGPWLLRAATRNGGYVNERYNGVGFRLAASLP